MELTVSQRIGLLVDEFTKGNKREFAHQIGVSQQGIYNLLVGRNDGEPSFRVLSAILSRFPAISADWLMTGNGPMLRSNGLSIEADEPATVAEAEALAAKNVLATQQQELAQLREQLAMMGKQVDFLLRRVAELS